MKTLGITFRELLDSKLVKWDDLFSVFVPKLLPGKITHELVVVGHFKDEHILRYADRPMIKLDGTPGYWDVWIGKEEVIDELHEDPQGDLVGTGAAWDQSRRYV